MKTTGLGIKGIPEDMLWPDAWKLNINIRDLTPNNFNLYAEYYLNGVNQAQLSTFQNTMNIGNIVHQAIDYISGLTALASSEQIKNMIKSITGQIKGFYDKFKPTSSSQAANAAAAAVQGFGTQHEKEMMQAFTAARQLNQAAKRLREASESGRSQEALAAANALRTYGKNLDALTANFTPEEWKLYLEVLKNNNIFTDMPTDITAMTVQGSATGDVQRLIDRYIDKNTISDTAAIKQVEALTYDQIENHTARTLVTGKGSDAILRDVSLSPVIPGIGGWELKWEKRDYSGDRFLTNYIGLYGNQSSKNDYYQLVAVQVDSNGNETGNTRDITLWSDGTASYNQISTQNWKLITWASNYTPYSKGIPVVENIQTGAVQGTSYLIYQVGNVCDWRSPRYFIASAARQVGGNI